MTVMISRDMDRIIREAACALARRDYPGIVWKMDDICFDPAGNPLLMGACDGHQRMVMYLRQAVIERLELSWGRMRYD